jgi:ATP-dependent DNA helicase RecQ
VASVFRALQARAAEGRTVSLRDLHAEAADVPQPKLRVVLALLKDAGVVRELRGVKFRLLEPDRTTDDLEALTAGYHEREEADRARLDRMIMYAQTALCRWKALLAYFGEATDIDRCGHCDNCARPPVAVAEAVDRQQPAPDLLHQVHQAQTPWAVGECVRTAQGAEGEILAIHDDKIDVRHADGETRTYKREFLARV